MKLRCDLNVNGGERRILICQGPSEPEEHLALKLGAYVLFWDHDPLIDASPKLPALAAFDFLPDVLCLDASGDIALWVECGSYTMNKLTKLTRRVPVGRGRIVVLKPTERDAQRMRRDVDEQLDRPQRIEILAWPGDTFKSWISAVAEKTEIYGEASALSINAVVNEVPVAVDFRRF
jgi:uncharacterized protein YaeQ